MEHDATDARSSEVLWNVTKHCDEADFSDNRMNMTRHTKIWPIVEKMFSDSYGKYYSLTEHTVVEIIVLVKGRIIFKQYVPKKHKWLEIKKITTVQF